MIKFLVIYINNLFVLKLFIQEVRCVNKLDEMVRIESLSEEVGRAEGLDSTISITEVMFRRWIIQFEGANRDLMYFLNFL